MKEGCSTVKNSQTSDCEEDEQSQNNAKIKFYKCLTCSAEYKSQKNYKNHIKNGHKKEGFFCEKCGLNFMKKTGLNQHFRRTHNNDKKLSCPHCQKIFNIKSNLDRHILLHTEYKQTYVCEKCGVKFWSKSGLKEHIDTIHKQSREFECILCKKAFVSKRCFLRHEAVHTNERKFKCDLCTKIYKLKTHLQRHKLQTHKFKTKKKLKRFMKNEDGELVPIEDLKLKNIPTKEEKKNNKIKLQSFSLFPNQTNLMNIIEECNNIDNNTQYVNVNPNINYNVGIKSVIEINNSFNSENNLQNFNENNYVLPDTNIELNENLLQWQTDSNLISLNDNKNKTFSIVYSLNNQNNQIMETENSYLINYQHCCTPNDQQILPTISQEVFNKNTENILNNLNENLTNL